MGNFYMVNWKNSMYSEVKEEKRGMWKRRVKGAMPEKCVLYIFFVCLFWK